MTPNGALTYFARRILTRLNVSFQTAYSCLFPIHPSFPTRHAISPESLRNIYIIETFFNNYIVQFSSSSKPAPTLRPQLNLHSGSGCFPVLEVFLIG